ncbi:MAG: hypothetical protein AB1921_19190 [Thermodesulfobacteriota bacterium]
MRKILIFLVLLSVCATFSCLKKKEVFYFKSVTPPMSYASGVPQAFGGFPPLLRPEGKRSTIEPSSQYFTLVIPNCIDISNKAGDLRKSLADILYTEIFKTRRFNLYDRWELVDLDPAWLERALMRQTETPAATAEGTGAPPAAQAAPKPADFTAQEELALREYSRLKDQERTAQQIRDRADGLLLVYITSRTGAEDNGEFTIDYRIVSTQRQIVLFAERSTVRYFRSTKSELEYNREDIAKIAEDIFKVFPNPVSPNFQQAHVVSIDGNRIAIDVGENHGLIPGMQGYVVSYEDSIFTGDGVRATEHCNYLARFVITEIYPKTCTGYIYQPGENADIRIGDAVRLK